jgi:PAS domain S-box-containing protein
VPATLSIAILGFALIVTAHVADDLLQAGELARHLRISTSNLDEVSSNLRLVEESAGLGLWRWQAGSDQVRLSERSAHIFGRGAAGDFGLADLLTAIDPDDWQRVRAAALAIAAGDDREFGGHFRVVGARGKRSQVAVHGRLLRDAGSALVGAHGIIIDVSSQDGNDVVFGIVLDASPIAILVVDERGRIVRANEAAARLSGYPVADLVGMAIDALVPPEARAAHADLRHRYATAATRRPMLPAREVQLLTRDGARKSVRVTLDPLLHDGRNMVIATVFDHTEQQRLEHERTLQRAALAHVARVGMLAELSGSLAHEINQPLAAILSNAQASQRFLGRPEPDLGEVRDGLAEIVDNAKRAGEVIRRLRGMLRNDPPELADIDIRRKVVDAIDLLHSDLVARRVHVYTHFHDGLPAVRGDPVQLQQVLINLLVNAADAMAGVDGERRIDVSVRASEGGALIEVADVGTGIPPDDLERIFQAFVSTKAEGLGFGLPLCRTLVQAHGGKLWASNNEGPGATFHVLLPAPG